MGCNGAKFVREQDVERQTVEQAVDSSPHSKLTVSNEHDGRRSRKAEVAVNAEDTEWLNEISVAKMLTFIPGDAEAPCLAAEEGKASRFSLGTMPDQVPDGVARSFQSKKVSLETQARFHFDSSQQRCGFACKKGLKPEIPNQDAFCVLKWETHHLYGVFDGHGRYGHAVSQFVRENLPKVLLSQETFESNPEQALRNAFEKMQYLIVVANADQRLDALKSGTTCSLVLHSLRDNMIYVAHVGDSRVVLGTRSKPDGEVEAMELTTDHKPTLPAEKARIEKAGGEIFFDGGWNHRVFVKDKINDRGKRYPGLNMSRSMGDLTGFREAGISALPDILVRPLARGNALNHAPAQDKIVKDLDSHIKGHSDLHPITIGATGGEDVADDTSTTVSSHSTEAGVDQFIILCSDGVWEFIKSREAVDEVAKFPPVKAGEAAEHLAIMAWDRWILNMSGAVVDDITALVVHF